MPKITFIHPPEPYLMVQDTQIPIGILYMGAVIERDRPDWVVRAIMMPPKSIKGCVDLLDESEIFGITTTSLDYHSAKDLAVEIKKRYPGSKVIIGGPHVNCLKGDIGLHPFDSVAQGEGEMMVLRIVDDFPNVKPHYFGEQVKDLDSLPFPARHLLPFTGGEVFMYNEKYSEGSTTTLNISRGCPHKCAFCANALMWSGTRYRSIENVVAEVKEVIEKYGVKMFRISDDSLASNQRKLKEICAAFNPLGIFWRISVRVKPNSVEMFKMMYDAGCREVSFGVESGDQRVLDFLEKGVRLEDAEVALKNAKSVGLKVKVLFMTGTPGEHADSGEVCIKWLRSFREYFDFLAAKPYVPMPGSPVWEDPVKYRCDILVKDYSKLNMYFFRADEDEFHFDEPLIKNWDLTHEQRFNNMRKVLNYLKEQQFCYVKDTGYEK